MPRIGRANEVVERNTERPPLAHELIGNGGGILFRTFPHRCRSALDLLAMFVGSGCEDNRLITLLSFESFDQISRERAVSGTDMRRCVHVIDRCCEVVLSLTHRDVGQESIETR